MEDESNSENVNPEFHDPLGVKPAPISSSPSNESEDTDIDIQPMKSEDLDRILAEAREYEATRRKPPSLEEPEEDVDLFVAVDNPEKHASAMETYITFRVTTKTTRAEYDQSEYSVRRRYSDFLWLRNMLEKTQPTHLIPPLPEKHSLKRLDHFSQEFVKTRQRLLEKFLCRIATHPVLSCNKHFVTFLTAKKSEFQASRKEGTSTVGRWAESFHNTSAAYMMKTRSPEFTDMGQYVQTFSEKLGTMERISQRLVREQYDLLQDLNSWGPHFTLWSNSEDKLSNALSAFAKAVEKCYLALHEVYDATETEFNQHVKEYSLYTEAIKAVLKRRDAIQMEYEMTLEELKRKKEERDAGKGSEITYTLGSFLGRNSEELKQEREEKLASKTEELQQSVEVLNDRMVCADSDLKADMDRWHKRKTRDFKKVFCDLCDRQVAYYEQTLAAWEEAIPLIQRTDQAAVERDEDDLQAANCSD